MTQSCLAKPSAKLCCVVGFYGRRIGLRTRRFWCKAQKQHVQIRISVTYVALYLDKDDLPYIGWSSPPVWTHMRLGPDGSSSMERKDT